MAPICMSAITSVATAMTPRNSLAPVASQRSPAVPSRARRCAPARRLPCRARRRCVSVSRWRFHELAPLPGRFARLLASFARLLRQHAPRLLAGGRGHQQRHRRAGDRARARTPRRRSPLRVICAGHMVSSACSSENADPDVQSTSSGSLLDRPRSALSARSRREFILSYNSLLCSSWPAVPLALHSRFFVSSSSRPTVLFKQSYSSFSVSSLPAVLSPRFSRAADLLEVRRVAVSDFASLSSFSSWPRLPSPALILRGHLLEVGQRRVQLVVGPGIVGQLAERAAAPVDRRRPRRWPRRRTRSISR